MLTILIPILLAIVIFYFIYNSNPSSKFNQKQISGFVFQAFETAHILKTTKNIEIYQSRYDLFKEKLGQLIELKSDYQYKVSFDEAVSKYKQMYYDRTLNGTIKDGLFEPQTFNLKLFFEQTFFNCISQNIKVDYKKMEGLKTEKAKQNRIDKINVKFDAYLEYLILKGYDIDSEFYQEINKKRQLI